MKRLPNLVVLINDLKVVQKKGKLSSSTRQKKKEEELYECGTGNIAIT